MLGQVVNGRTGINPSSNRYFRYEVVGLRQSEATDSMDYPIRSSASTFVTVPYSRMNEEMQRITRMGGKIVNIKPVMNGGE
jgi:sulfite reductase alpha subunit-like flavoprotein